MPANFLLSLIPLSFIAGALIAIAVYTLANPTQYHSYSPSEESKSFPSNSQPAKKIKIKNPCRICGSEINDLENDMTKLPCDHEFHVNCISRHFNRTKNPEKMSTCPVQYCEKSYSLSSK